MSEIRTNERLIEQNGEQYAISIFSGDGKAYDRMQAEAPDVLHPRVGTLIYRHLGAAATSEDCQIDTQLLEQEADELYLEAQTVGL